MDITCRNCQNTFTGNYCNICGQPSNISDFTAKNLWKELAKNSFKFDKVFGRTLKQLFTRPGFFIKDYISGKRIQYTGPITFVLIVAGIYSGLFLGFNINLFTFSSDGRIDVNNLNRLGSLINSNFAIVELISLPVISLGSYIVFKNEHYNFVKHLVANAYLLGQRIVVQILFFPLLYVYNNTITTNHIINLASLIGIFLFVWAIMQIFETQSRVKVVSKAIFTYVVSYLFVLLIIISTVILFSFIF